MPLKSFPARLFKGLKICFSELMKSQQFLTCETHLSLDLLAVFLLKQCFTKLFGLLLFFLFLPELSLDLIGDEGKKLHCTGFGDQGGHVKAPDLFGHNHMVCTGQAQLFLRFGIFGPADDAEVRVELPGGKYNEYVIGVLR